MLTYKDFSKHFGSQLGNNDFQIFLTGHFSDLTDYNVVESDYIVSEVRGIELGFTNDSVIFDEDDQTLIEIGDPIFSYFNIYPKASAFIDELPFSLTFNDTRSSVLEKVGTPIHSFNGQSDLFNQVFLVDTYHYDNLSISIDYYPIEKTIKHIQLRDNSLTPNLV